MNYLRLKYGILFFFCNWLIGSVPLAAQHRVSEEEVNTQKVFIDASKEKILGKYENAIYLYKEVLKRDKDNHPAAYELARIYYARENIDKSIKSIQMAIALEPNNEWYQLFLAGVYDENGNPREAVKIYRKLVEQAPNNDYFLEKLAFSLVKANEIKAAIDVYDQFEDRFGISEDISRRKHRLYLGLGNQGKAAAELEKLIRSAPSNTDYYHMLASFYQQTGKNNQASEVYERIIAVDSTDVRASIALAGENTKGGGGISYLKNLRPVFEKGEVNIDLKIKELIPYIHEVADTQEPELVKTTLELAAILEQVHPQEAKSYSAYGDLLYYSGDKTSALVKYQKAMELNKSIFTVWEQIMYIQTELNQFESLLELTEKAMDRFPNKAKAYYFNGLAQGQLKNHKKAVNSLKQSLMMSRKDPPLQVDIYNHLATEYYQLGKFEASDQSFEKALDLNPKDHRVLNRYAFYLALRASELNKAKEMAAKANELAPNQPNYQDTYGWILYKMKEYEASKDWISKALANGGDSNPIILEHYGDALYQLKETDQAVSYWQQALEKGGASSLLEKKIANRQLYE